VCVQTARGLNLA